MSRRRRDLSPRLCWLLVSTIFFVSFVFRSFVLDFGLIHASLPASVLSASFLSPSHLIPRRDTPGSDHLSGIPRRLFSLCSLKLSLRLGDIGGTCSLFRPELGDFPQIYYPRKVFLRITHPALNFSSDAFFTNLISPRRRLWRSSLLVHELPLGRPEVSSPSLALQPRSPMKIHQGHRRPAATVEAPSMLPRGN